MASDFSGDGDPKRSIALLWGVAEAGRRGPKPRRSVDEVVAAAIALADAEGLGALSMRRVAEAVGLSPMSLYTYVPSKAELLDLMMDRAAGEIVDPEPDLRGWRPRLEDMARQRWAMGLRHPWILQRGAHRPTLGPNLLAQVEVMLTAMDGLGLSGMEMNQVISLVADYVRGAVRAALDARDAERESGITDEQWWSLNNELLKGLFDPARYPTTTRVGEAYKAASCGGPDPGENFEFGLQRVLDGIAVFIGARGGAV
jgi:AcrR family transcriptional regulator